jgi:hypothetical protein
MATITNGTGVYTTLGYNFSDPNGYVEVLSANTQAHLNAMPAFISTWQAQDIANNSVGGYFQNPVANSIQIIWNTANSLIISCNSVNSLSDMYNTAVSLSSTANSFMQHTNRLSNIIPYTGQDLTNPYYQTATSLGKIALYITNQTDSISNTSPILGSFSSILVGPQLSQNANTVNTYISLVSGSVSGNTSNLTNTQVNQINSDLSNTDNYLAGRQSADVAYYTNLQTFTNNYNTLKQFTNMGETQTYLLNNFIGTPKIVSRINS